jgi:predicted transcriptional regulator
MPGLDDVNPATMTENVSASSTNIYRDRIYIIKDIILKLVEYNEMNQTALFSFCGLNLKKHKPIIDDLEKNGLIQKKGVTNGKRVVTMYKSTPEGIKFCKSILEPYENMFPRNKPINDN